MQNATIRMPIIDEYVVGKMIRFNFEDNHGLIERLDTHEVIYVHKNEIINDTDMLKLPADNNSEEGRIL